jgi:hypothetical protein
MKATILKPFTMGSLTYSDGVVCEFSPDRIPTLVERGLVAPIEELKETPVVTPPAEEKNDSLSHKKRRKR